MRWLDLLYFVFFPRQGLTNYQTCRREGCGFSESIRIALASLICGGSDVGIVLNDRLEEMLWRSEHPGFSEADLEAWRDERLLDQAERCRAMLRAVKERHGF